MGHAIKSFGLMALGALFLAGCGGMDRRGGLRPGGNPPPPSDREQNIRLMITYDGNSDGMVTRAELEEGLRRQFVAADVNGDGRLDGSETRAENDRRFRASGTGASPLIDWNQDGFVSVEEFGTTARSVFDELDRDHNGVLDSDEIRLPRGRGAPGVRPMGARRQRP